jgi:cob(I)alamin adenosyltransferase
MSKGTVQAEELRGQLGERIPGAFQMAARAMGVSAAELNKLLEQGKVLSDDFLPKFAQELRRTFAGALPEAVDSAQANLNRFQTQLFSLKVDLARSGFMDAVLSVLGAISATLKDPGFNQSIRDVGAGFKALAGDGETLTTALGGVLWIVQRLIIGFATLNATRKVLTAGWDDFTFAGLDSAKETLELQIADIEQRLSDLPGEDNPLTKIFNFDALKSSEQRRNLTALLDEAKTKLTGVNAQLAAMGGDKTGLEVFEQEIEKLEKLINRVSNPDPIKIPTVVLPPLQKTPGGSSGVGGEDAEHEPTVAQQLKYLRQVNKELEKSTDGAMESFRGLASQLEATGGPMAQITAGLELYNHETDRAGAGMKDMAEEGNAAFAELENAVEGWASNFSAELNDMFWSADLTFSGILESFGRMLSQMVIQKQIVEPLLGAGMNFLSGLGGGAAPSGGGAEFGAKALGSGNFTLRHDGGPIIPRFHTGGLLSDEVPAILQTGERVLSREQNRTFDKLAALLDGGGQGNAGAVEVNVINNAQGTAARTEERQQGGRRIVDVIVETVEGAIGAGRLDRAMGSNFGVSRSGVRR